MLTKTETRRRARISASLRRVHATKPGAGLGLRALILRAASNECPFCGDARAVKKNSNGILALTCGDVVCTKAYHRYWRRDQRARRAA